MLPSTPKSRELGLAERILASAADGIIAADGELRYTHWNAAMERISGKKAAEVLGRPIAEVFPVVLQSGAISRYQRALRGEEVAIREDEFLSPTTGVTGYFDTIYSPIRDSAGSVVGLVAVIRDVTARVMEARAAAARTEELIALERHARELAEAANRTKADFLAIMSHELRTPLNAIGGYTELLLMGVRGTLTAQQREDLARIQRSQHHLLSLINDVLNFAKLEAGRVEYHFDDMNVAELLGSIEPLVMPQLEERNLAYEAGNADPGIVVRADMEKVRQVLLNLLSNAVKFTAPGGKVSVTCAQSDATVEIHVTDTGVGIAEDKLEQIFEPFVQLQRGLTTRHGGTGLGLAISRDLARGMGGELTVTSRPGEGSRFTLRLPRRNTAHRRAEDEE